MSNVYIRESYIDKNMFVVMVYSQFQGMWTPSQRMEKNEAQELVDFYKKNEGGA